MTDVTCDNCGDEDVVAEEPEKRPYLCSLRCKKEWMENGQEVENDDDGDDDDGDDDDPIYGRQMLTRDD